MNLSGHFVIQLARYFRIEPPQILLIYDEAALPTGVIKLRQGGSSGGHNGVQNVIDQLGQADFMRLRIGIGPVQGNLENYVLSPFNAAQIAVLNNQKKRLIEMVKTVVDEGLESAMNRFH
ncbi:uncharacterized protein LOC111613623 [Centruroides sculpturatus]|uniref:uncharacterized protein LOC111613623 n=1 Tax=Centruroides sculpturatus TaxID=218467 RepID=UPI000C6E70AE|nr:uncharacterized protein LOC111613623 [Centruroides sculpturatus]